MVHPAVYDDGGISGGTMERPALKRLLEDIDRGMIDVVVVYKVDRLTRSLTDFAKIVERFDARSVSFVSVTQAFNTTNSMGRLTLNVLLSFAQFEREVTGERIRDTIAASKAKGMWMGGNLPLGYDVPTDPVTRALVINPQEAEGVRRLFKRYLELGSVHAVKAEFDAEGLVTAVKTYRTGAVRGGVPWSRGNLFRLLRNRVYLGEIVHRGKSYPGAHPAIIDPETFAAVQKSLDENGSRRRARPLMPEGSPLCGRIFDAEGVPMTTAMAYGKAGRKYRYYVSRPLQVGQGANLDRETVRRVAAGAIEGMVMERLSACRLIAPDAGWAAIRDLVERVTLGRDEVVVRLRSGDIGPAQLADARNELSGDQRLVERSGRTPALELIIPGRPVFRGGRTWMASPDGRSLARTTTVDKNLIRGLRKAHALTRDHGISPLSSVDDNRTGRGVTCTYHRSMAQLAFLAPDIQSAILEGRQPAGLTLESLLKTSLPAAWSEQRVLLGFATAIAERKPVPRAPVGRLRVSETR